MQLYPIDPSQPDSIYLQVKAGTIESLATQYYQELILKGYSLLPEDVETVFIEAVKLYASHAILECQRIASNLITIDKNLILHGGEFAVIEPLIRAHCDVIQADLVEGSGSLGAERFGLSKSEAEQFYKEEKEKLPKAAFVQPPFSFKTLGGH